MKCRYIKIFNKFEWLAFFALMTPSLLLLSSNNDLQFALITVSISTTSTLILRIMLGNAKLFWRFSMPFFLLLPFELYFCWKFNYPSTRITLSLIAETSYAEATEFFSGHYVNFIFATLLSIFIWWQAYRHLEPSKSYPNKIRIWAGIILLSLILIPDGLRQLPIRSDELKSITLTNAYPAGFFLRVGGFVYNLHKTIALESDRQNFYFNAITKRKRMTVVLVIGESSRPTNWSLGGYARETTPRLKHDPNGIFIPDMITPWSLTTLSVPVLLTRKPADFRGLFYEKSIISAFAEAGFKTSWFGNQSGMMEIDILSRESNYRHLYSHSLGRGDEDVPYDERMLPDIFHAMEDPGPLKFIVVHMKGSHWDYHRRYPPKFRLFYPDTVNNESGKYDARNREILINAYDNSIVYCDYILDQIKTKLAKSDGDSAMLFVSDHGQSIYDNGCNIFGQGNDTEANFRSASYLWLKGFSNKDMCVAKENCTNKLTTVGVIFNTLADMGQLNIVNSEMSLLSEHFAPTPRWVNTHRGVREFDQTKRQGPCRLLVEGH